MDNYCRTCMRDSKLFSQIFEEMTYGGISLQEALQEICQLEVSNGDELPAYVCRDCALKLYDIVKFKIDACDVDRTLRRLRVINRCIKVENEETREEECVNVVPIKAETIHGIEGPESHTIVVSGTPCFLPGDTVSYPDAVSANHDPCAGDVIEKNLCSEMESFEEDMPRLKLEDSDSEEEIVERVSDAPGCSSKDIRTHSGAECSTESCNDQSELNINIQKNFRGKRSVIRRKVEVMEVHSKQNEHSSKDTVDNSVFDDKLHSNLNVNNKESKINMSDGYKLRLRNKGRIYKKLDDLEENLPNSPKDRLDRDVAGKNVICNNGSPGNSKKRESGKEAISKTDLIKSKEKMILKEKSIVIKSPLITNSKERSLVGGFYCDICKKGFKSKRDLGRHVRVHNGVRPFKCSICNRSFKTMFALRRHNIVHSYGGPHACNQCDKSFKEEFYLKKHIEIHKKKYICKICSKIFNYEGTLDKHMQIHGNYNKFPCIVCGRNFKCELDFNKHFQSHGRKYPFTCKICGKGSFTKRDYKSHQLTHTDKKPFSCNLCGKTFKRKSHLKEHSNSHEGLKHKCSVCGKGISSMGNLSKHMETHSKLQTYSCPKCCKTFANSRTLKVHLKFTCKS